MFKNCWQAGHAVTPESAKGVSGIEHMPHALLFECA